MKSKIFVALAALAVSSAHAGFYAGGSLNHFNDRNQTANATGTSSTQALTNRVGLRSLGLEAQGGYAGANGKFKYAGELFVNGGHATNGEFNNGQGSSTRTGLTIGLVGKAGFDLNDKTTIYGRLGLASQSSKVKNVGAAGIVKGSANAIAAIVGVELETALCPQGKLKGFIAYDYIAPLQTKDVKDGSTVVAAKFKNERQVFKIGARYYF